MGGAKDLSRERVADGACGRRLPIGLPTAACDVAAAPPKCNLTQFMRHASPWVAAAGLHC